MNLCTYRNTHVLYHFGFGEYIDLGGIVKGLGGNVSPPWLPP